ncbi:Predicted secreted protein [[Flavobacterium] thermophilum]|nr:Predicted secreted protein [[Flavobacterium] thermophilum]
MKRTIASSLLWATLLAFPAIAAADAAPGDVIVTLGENLTAEQKQKVLEEMKAPDGAQTITVSNAEEHKYLDGLIPKAQIGTRAISSSMITIGEPGSGLHVETHNITWVTKEMYTNALITAGVKDADIYITAPFPVSGTAALTGLMKAYEISSDKAIPDDVKKVANEEMVQTAKLADSIGADKAVALLAKIKEEIANNPPQTDADLRALIEKIANDLGITLSADEINALVSLFHKMQNADINWDQVNDQLSKAKEQLSAFLQSEEGKTFIQNLIDILKEIWNAIKSAFSANQQ